MTISKHSEAIREGVQDVEYLTMLSARISRVRQVHPKRKSLAEAVDLANAALTSVLQSPGAADMSW